MAAFFASASSQKLLNSVAPVTGPPFSVGFWAYPTTTGTTRYLWSLSDTAGTINYYTIAQSASNDWNVLQTDDASPTGGTAGVSAVTANQWVYIVARYISGTNRRMAVKLHTGEIVHAAGAINDNPTGIDVMAFGCLNHSAPTGFFDGGIAEFWMTNSDIQADGAQLLDSTVRQLAYGGPFSVPHIAKNIIEYRSFRKYPSSEGDDPSEVFHGVARQTWTNTNGVTIGPHPPLPYWYVKPGQTARILTV